MSSSSSTNITLDLQMKIMIITGLPLDSAPALREELEKKGEDAILREILDEISHINLADKDKSDRIYLIDAAVKSGNLILVKAITEKFIEQGFQSDITIPSKDNLEHPYRPTFWLASIVSRYKDKSHYEAIEKYLCEKFHIPSTVEINGKAITREGYIAHLENWKHKKNISFMVEYSRKMPRYRRHELLESIEKFNPDSLKKSPKK